VHRSLAIRGDRVVAVGDAPQSLDELIGPDTRVIEEPGWTLLPGFTDTHTHLIFAGRAIRDVAVERATTLSGLLGLIGERAAAVPAGEWIRTNSAWHELNPAERRFPTRWELDGVAPENPVLVKRGGHNDVCNSLALKLGGIGRDTPDPPGGKVFRDSRGEPTGLLQETPAFASVEAAMPPPSFEEQVENLALASEDYARKGLCAVRDCAVEPHGEIDLLHAVHDRGRLAVRTCYLVLATAVGSVDERVALLDALTVRSDSGDAMLRVWGLKVILDGGAEGGATCEPYCNDPDEHGILIWNVDELALLAEYALKNGWRVGTHAVGDRAVRVTLEAYERALAANPGTPSGSLVIEHGFLVGPEQRARAIRLRVPITVQHPLLFTLAAELIQNLGDGQGSRGDAGERVAPRGRTRGRRIGLPRGSVRRDALGVGHGHPTNRGRGRPRTRARDRPRDGDPPLHHERGAAPGRAGSSGNARARQARRLRRLSGEPLHLRARPAGGARADADRGWWPRHLGPAGAPRMSAAGGRESGTAVIALLDGDGAALFPKLTNRQDELRAELGEGEVTAVSRDLSFGYSCCRRRSPPASSLTAGRAAGRTTVHAALSTNRRVN
jgi:predicted amidohydrolase YtcJ